MAVSPQQQTALQPTPPALVKEGRVQTGFFQTPFRHVDLLAADLVGPKPLRWLRLKEWVGYGLHHPRFFGGILIQNAKYAASATVFLYDKQTQHHHEWQLAVLPWQASLPETLWHGQSLCQKGRDFVRFDHDVDHGRHVLTAQFAAKGNKPALDFALTALQDNSAVQPLVVSLPIGQRHHTYTHKSLLRLQGTVKIGPETHVFEPDRDRANLDEQKTFYPYQTQWKWGCFYSKTAQGHEVLVNVVHQMTPHGQQGEDAIWFDGQLRLIPQPTIVALPEPGHFQMESPGALRLRFVTAGTKREVLNYGVVGMHYDQFYGPYSGEVCDPQGQWHDIGQVFGALEVMAARF
jgi:hypothetical protein